MWDNEQTLEYKEAVGICLGTVISNFFSQYVASARVVDSREAVRNEVDNTAVGRLESVACNMKYF